MSLAFSKSVRLINTAIKSASVCLSRRKKRGTAEAEERFLLGTVEGRGLGGKLHTRIRTSVKETYIFQVKGKNYNQIITELMRILT